MRSEVVEKVAPDKLAPQDDITHEKLLFLLNKKTLSIIITKPYLALNFKV